MDQFHRPYLLSTPFSKEATGSFNINRALFVLLNINGSIVPEHRIEPILDYFLKATLLMLDVRLKLRLANYHSFGYQPPPKDVITNRDDPQSAVNRDP
ncbi:hypothetical protein [Catellatospora vulcania]|uniref:hypothetical protein n=1 Tax=Catellatospora vulcania TaxID=1460450 RepID=UPI0018AF69DE|nr:hypothetical protein [Catellatospora vulcania]